MTISFAKLSTGCRNTLQC